MCTVLIYLLQHVQDNYETVSAYGSYIKPGTVLRCDGKDREQLDEPNLSVTFISYPYFDVSNGKWPKPPRDISQHLSKGLFQQSYPQEIAHDRDSNQSFHKFKRSGISSKQFLRVPQLWILILNKTTIITCGPSSLSSTFRGGIEIVSEEALLKESPGLIHVSVSSAENVFYLPVENCKTFLALRSSLQKECLKDTEDSIDDYFLYLGDDNEELDAGHWPKILQTRQSALIYIRMSRQKSVPKSGLPPPKKLLALDYKYQISRDEEQRALVHWRPG